MPIHFINAANLPASQFEPLPTSGDIVPTASDTIGHGNGGVGSLANEGVGNGVDLPPPGHYYNFNDALGTDPGFPGAQGGNGYVPAEFVGVSSSFDVA